MDNSYEKVVPKIYTKEEKRDLWEVAIGLNKVDNLEQSDLFYKLMESEINGEIDYKEVTKILKTYYAVIKNEVDVNPELIAEKEADLVGVRMAELLTQNGFTFSIGCFMAVHKYIFQDVFTQLEEKYLGKMRDYDVTKKEFVLNGESAEYASFNMINQILEHYFDAEKDKKYYKQTEEVIVKQISEFTSNIWQAHPFIEGNTRTTALFIEKYLKSMKLPIAINIFKDNSLSFRNSLVMANQNDAKKNDINYLKVFFEKGLFNPEKVLLDILPTPSDADGDKRGPI